MLSVFDHSPILPASGGRSTGLLAGDKSGLGVPRADDGSVPSVCSSARDPSSHALKSVPFTAIFSSCQALTNMIEAGYQEKEVMEIGGWKTAHVFRRYVIVSSRRMQANAEKLASYLAEKAEKEAEEERRITADATADKPGRIQ